jgi:hypothetical protein
MLSIKALGQNICIFKKIKQMIHLHATGKMLNWGKIDGKTLITQHEADQKLDSWYVTIIGSSFRGKMLVLYIHEPSLMTVLTHGKTIRTTHPEFKVRLKHLLNRYGFPENFVTRELFLINEFVIGKTTNRSTLAKINQITYLLGYWVYQYNNYANIDLDILENRMMNHLSSNKISKDYSTPIDFFEKLLDCRLVKNEY